MVWEWSGMPALLAPFVYLAKSYPDRNFLSRSQTLYESSFE